MEQNVLVRRATEADLDAVERLYGEVCDYLDAHQNYPDWRRGVYPTRRDAEEALHRYRLGVAQIGERIVGTFVLKHETVKGYENARWLTENDYARIYVLHTFAVHPDFLREGVGSRLLRGAEEMAREESCVSLRLDVVKGNVPAERLYQKSGYRFIGTVSLGYESTDTPWFNLYEKALA